MTIRYQLYGLPHKRNLRLTILGWMSLRPNLKSSTELSAFEVEKLLNRYFELWRDGDVEPTGEEKARIRRIAENLSAQLEVTFAEVVQS